MKTLLNNYLQHSKNKILILLITQSLPLFFAQLIATAANVFDLILIGHAIGGHAMAILGISGNIFNTVQIGFTGILIALIPVISAAHAIGKKSKILQLV